MEYDPNDSDIKTTEYSVVDQSLTAQVKVFLDWEADRRGNVMPVGERIETNHRSILEIANAQGLTLQQYVTKNPDKAILEAESTLADWLRVQTSAALTGELNTEVGAYAVTKNMTKLIGDRAAAAEKQRDLVYEYAYTAIQDGERKRDHLIRTAYNRAVFRGDTRMLIYLMDRVDGRPGESKVADLDYDNAYNVYQIIHTLFDKQLEVLNSGAGTKLICCSRRCIADDTLVRMYDGTCKQAKDLVVGDKLMGDDSTPRTIQELEKSEGELIGIYKQSGELVAKVSTNEELAIWNSSKGALLGKVSNRQKANWGIPCNDFGTMNVLEYKQHLALKSSRRYGDSTTLRMAMRGYDLPVNTLPIHPYLFGAWLGDGFSSNSVICGADTEIVDWIEANVPGAVRKFRDDRQPGLWEINFHKRSELAALGVLVDYNKAERGSKKRIPVVYLLGSFEQRCQLLAGIIDTDGCRTRNNAYEICLKGAGLASDVQALCQSLGISVTMAETEKYCYYNGEKRSGTYYRLHFHLSDLKIPCLVPRKRPVKQVRFDNRNFLPEFIDEGVGTYVSFTLDGNKRYLLGNGVVMHNSGKTHLLVAACMIECLRTANTTCLYIGETLEITEGLINQAANQIIDQCKLRDRRGKRLNWRRFDNGSQILVRGLSNTKDPDLIRGHKAKIIVVDEFFHLKGELLNYLVQEVLQPMQLDYAADYKFLCAGTPPPIKGTYGEKAWKTWEVPHFIWTYKDNPFPNSLAEREEYVLKVLQEKGLDWSSTLARREYGGQWVYDEDLMLYPEFHTYNPRETYPSFNIDQVLFGIDYGVGDHDTLIGVAWDTAERRGYVFYEDKFNRLDIKDRTVSQLQYLESCILRAWEIALEFFPTLEPKEANKRILWDADDNEQRVTDHFNLNLRLKKFPDLRLNIANAHKTQKVQMFDKIRDLLRTAHLLFIEDGVCAKEAQKTVLKRGPNGQVYPEVDMKAYHPDALPALRYALWNVIGQESVPKEAM